MPNYPTQSAGGRTSAVQPSFHARQPGASSTGRIPGDYYDFESYTDSASEIDSEFEELAAAARAHSQVTTSGAWAIAACANTEPGPKHLSYTEDAPVNVVQPNNRTAGHQRSTRGTGSSANPGCILADEGWAEVGATSDDDWVDIASQPATGEIFRARRDEARLGKEEKRQGKKRYETLATSQTESCARDQEEEHALVNRQEEAERELEVSRVALERYRAERVARAQRAVEAKQRQEAEDLANQERLKTRTEVEERGRREEQERYTNLEARLQVAEAELFKRRKQDVLDEQTAHQVEFQQRQQKQTIQLAHVGVEVPYQSQRLQQLRRDCQEPGSHDWQLKQEAHCRLEPKAEGQLAIDNSPALRVDDAEVPSTHNPDKMPPSREGISTREQKFDLEGSSTGTPAIHDRWHGVAPRVDDGKPGDDGLCIRSELEAPDNVATATVPTGTNVEVQLDTTAQLQKTLSRRARKIELEKQLKHLLVSAEPDRSAISHAVRVLAELDEEILRLYEDTCRLSVNENRPSQLTLKANQKLGAAADSIRDALLWNLTPDCTSFSFQVIRRASKVRNMKLAIIAMLKEELSIEPIVDPNKPKIMCLEVPRDEFDDWVLGFPGRER